MARPKEAVRIRWGDIDTKKRCWRIPKEMKNGKIPLTDSSIKILQIMWAICSN